MAGKKQKAKSGSSEEVRALLDDAFSDVTRSIVPKCEVGMDDGKMTFVCDAIEDAEGALKLLKQPTIEIKDRHPLSANAHFALGSFIGKLGQVFRNDEMVEEGINECRIATALGDGWDAPPVEVGIIFANVGRF